MNDVRKVVIVTGGSQGIGAGVVAGYRGGGWSVVASALTIKPSADPQVLTVDGDISEPATADLIIVQALDRFGRMPDAHAIGETTRRSRARYPATKFPGRDHSAGR
jgi:NAD(P)-dependent dehydrogenase (short-subunit alcohol dehydrogenase family)